MIGDGVSLSLTGIIIIVLVIALVWLVVRRR